MNNAQWETIKQCARGEIPEEVPVALIVDSPWIPGYLGLSMLDYLTVPEVWLEANLRVEREFPEIIFLPGFWAEMGMAAEPSGFGCRISFFPDSTPNVYPLISTVDEMECIQAPDPRTDGWMPILLNQYRRLESRINDAGHHIKVVAARGPLTLASHLMGVTEFLLTLKLHPAETHRFLKVMTGVVRTWLEAQVEALKEVEGILVLDDIAGFLSPKDYLQFAHPYLKAVFDAFPGAIKIFHNDNDNPVSYPYLKDLGIHIFNFTHLQPIAKVRELVGPDICLLGNVPPRDVLAQGSPDQVTDSARGVLEQHPSPKGLILSAGGGASPGTPAANLRTLSKAVNSLRC